MCPKDSDKNASRGFTLIELLIVVAIIAILAAIAVPNFLEAQTRSKASRAKADMRSLATALESYAVDYNRYPVCDHIPNQPSPTQFTGPSVFYGGTNGVSSRFIRLTTPVAYISSVFEDSFTTKGFTNNGTAGGGDVRIYDTYDYLDARTAFDSTNPFLTQSGRGVTSGCAWRISSCGPDRVQAFGGVSLGAGASNPSNVLGANYDPTNGSVSDGDIVRVGPGSSLGIPPFYDRSSGALQN